MANKAVLEFGTSKIICMIDSANIKGTDIPGAACVRYDGIKEGQWVNKKTLLDDVALAIDNAENRIKRQLKSVEVGIPGVFTKVMAIDGRKPVKENLITREFIDEMLRECAPRAGENDGSSWRFARLILWTTAGSSILGRLLGGIAGF